MEYPRTVAIQVRPATVDDVPILAVFQQAMAWDIEHKRLDLQRVHDGITALLQDPAKGFQLVAEAGGQVVGGLMVTYEWSDWDNRVYWWVQSVWVEPDWRQRGVYTALYRRLEAQARTSDDVCGIKLYVHNDNTTAQQVYKRLGMRRSPFAIYEIELRPE